MEDAAKRRKNFFVKTRPDQVVASLKRHHIDADSVKSSIGSASVIADAVPEDPAIVAASDRVERGGAKGAREVHEIPDEPKDQLQLDPELQAILDRVSSTATTTNNKPTYTDLPIHVHLTTAAHPPDHITTLPQTDTATPIKHILEQTVCKLRLPKKQYRVILPSDPTVTVFMSAAIASLGLCPGGHLIVAPASLSFTRESSFDHRKEREEREEQQVTLTVRFSPTRTDTATVSPSQALLPQLQALFQSARFTVDGERIAGSASCASLGLEDGDLVEVG